MARCAFRLRGDFVDDIVAQVPDARPNVRDTSLEASYSTLLWVRLGEGEKVGIVPALFAPNASAMQLAFRPLTEPDAWRSVYAVTAKGRPVPEAALGVVGLVKAIVEEMSDRDPAVRSLTL